MELERRVKKLEGKSVEDIRRDYEIKDYDDLFDVPHVQKKNDEWTGPWSKSKRSHIRHDKEYNLTLININQLIYSLKNAPQL